MIRTGSLDAATEFFKNDYWKVLKVISQCCTEYVLYRVVCVMYCMCVVYAWEGCISVVCVCCFNASVYPT